MKSEKGKLDDAPSDFPFFVCKKEDRRGFVGAAVFRKDYKCYKRILPQNQLKTIAILGSLHYRLSWRREVWRLRA